MSEYQKEREAARRRQERREKRAERRLRRVMKQESASLLDKMALAGAQEKIQDTLEAERDEFLEREPYVRAGKAKLRGYRNGFAKPRMVHLGGGSVEVELVGFTGCGGCPGGNIEYAPAEMIKNGAEVIHLATGMVVGYPPCPRLAFFADFLKEKHGVEVVIGTHPIPQKYLLTHERLGTWDGPEWRELLAPTLVVAGVLVAPALSVTVSVTVNVPAPA